MPSYLDGQLAGKFKGIPFFVRNETENNAGQTRVKHKYPKTSVQYMEPMGQEPFSETIDLFFSGPNFREDFQKFKKAIQDPAPGRLFSPTFGVFNSIVAEPASFTSNQKTLGEITASVTFSETIDRPAPTEADTSEQDVSEKAQAARNSLQDEFAAEYPEPETLNNVLTASEDAKALAKAIKQVTGKVREVRNFLRKVDQQIRNVQQYASLLLNPGQPIGFLQSLALSFPANSGLSIFKKIATIGNNLPNAMNDITSGIIPEPSSVIPSTPNTGGVDTNINLWDADTGERIARNQSRLSTVNVFRMTGLIGMYESAAASQYTTTDEIDEITETLESYYEALVENDTTNVIIPGMKSILDELRTLVDLVLAGKRQQAYTVTEIDILRPTSSFLLAYELYGEYIRTEAQLEFMSDLIKGLNRSQVANRLQGVVKVVEIGR